MEEIITKNNLDTYTQGLKGILSSMGEAINNAGSSNAGEEITITVTNISGNAHVDVKSGDTMIQSITSDGTSTVTIPFGIEYTIMGYDSTGLYVGGGVRAVANKMSSSISIDCTAVDGVDLGLPSGKIWAAKNVGASTNTDLGYRFQYGGILSESGTSNLSSALNDGDGITRPYTSGDPTYDAARYHMGGDWRIPTTEEVKELIDNCTWTWNSGNTVVTCTGLNGNIILFGKTNYYYGNNSNPNAVCFRTCGYRGQYYYTNDKEYAFASMFFYSPDNSSPRLRGIYVNYGVAVRAIRNGSV